jgi:hypothetical protein
MASFVSLFPLQPVTEKHLKQQEVAEVEFQWCYQALRHSKLTRPVFLSKTFNF